jgi:ORF6N domain-containing protein
MFDADLAALYGVETRALVQAVKRNAERFPQDFMFQLTDKEAEHLRSQFVTSSWGGRRYNPYAFTEHGVAMLSSVLRSKRAVEVNITIVRTFVRLRRILATHEDLARKVAQHDRQIAVLFDQVKHLLEPPPAPKKPPIGFIHPKG